MVIPTGKPRFTPKERTEIRMRYWNTGISQRKLADELGISRSTLRNILHSLNKQDKS